MTNQDRQRARLPRWRSVVPLRRPTVVVPVRLGHAIDDRWVILDGAKSGDIVIVDGFEKFVAGDVVSPKLWRETRQSDQPSTQPPNAADATLPP
jgi:multidrug efflux pump subunit AcrA (membrane-fusion protein)